MENEETVLCEVELDRVLPTGCNRVFVVVYSSPNVLRSFLQTSNPHAN